MTWSIRRRPAVDMPHPCSASTHAVQVACARQDVEKKVLMREEHVNVETNARREMCGGVCPGRAENGARRGARGADGLGIGASARCRHYGLDLYHTTTSTPDKCTATTHLIGSSCVISLGAGGRAAGGRGMGTILLAKSCCSIQYSNTGRLG